MDTVRKIDRHLQVFELKEKHLSIKEPTNKQSIEFLKELYNLEEYEETLVRSRQLIRKMSIFGPFTNLLYPVLNKYGGSELNEAFKIRFQSQGKLEAPYVNLNKSRMYLLLFTACLFVIFFKYYREKLALFIINIFEDYDLKEHPFIKKYYPGIVKLISGQETEGS